ncbi:MAG: hypothetical protein F6K39_23985 [Okeania sp. SIO3B3]|nr:hypothetical protein [Okeania sp. SIO3B3]
MAKLNKGDTSNASTIVSSMLNIVDGFTFLVKTRTLLLEVKAAVILTKSEVRSQKLTHP